jgi:hypothetical protein
MVNATLKWHSISEWRASLWWGLLLADWPKKTTSQPKVVESASQQLAKREHGYHISCMWAWVSYFMHAMQSHTDCITLQAAATPMSAQVK